MIIDMHVDTILRLMDSEQNLRKNDFHVDLEKLKKSDYLLQCFAMFVDLEHHENAFEYANLMIDKFNKELDMNSDLIRHAYSYDDIINNKNNGYISGLLTIEEGAVIEGNLANLEHFFDRGVRMITLTWNYETNIGFPNFKFFNGKPDFKSPNVVDGLTDFGKEVVEKMEELGIIVDVSHLSDKGIEDVLEITTKPFVASHSNARAVANVTRNLPDSLIRKMSEKGCVIGINFCPFFINDTEEPVMSDFINHIKHLKEIGGIDVIGLGTDYDGIKAPSVLPDASKMVLLKDALVEAGFTNEETDKIFYQNVQRLFRKVLK